ncbi:MAG TPA: ABC transporter permease [Bryobacteraceae bacterium]|nr:ABC transporter permease [Bryobacteraceae bacterium]
MLALRDDLYLAADAIRAHKLRASLTMLGLTMGVATLIAVMTLVQGANRYVEQKIANLGTDVFRISRLPFVLTDFSVVARAQRNKNISLEDMQAVAQGCGHCQYVGASVASTLGVRYRGRDLEDVALRGHTANMAQIDTRTLALGRYFTESEDRHAAPVCLLGDRLVQELFSGMDPVGHAVKTGAGEFMVVGTFESIGSVLGQDQDTFMVIPLNTYLRIRGARNSLTLEIKAAGSQQLFQQAQDDVRLILRARRHITLGHDEDFYVGTAESYISLWQSISSAFFAVFVMVSSISAVVGGIVIMNVMLVSVTERTKEIGIRRAMGATRQDILRQFLTESVMQCIVGGLIGVIIGFLCALAIRGLTSLPAAVQTWVAILGVILSSIIGLFFGIYPAMKAAKLDPVTALRTE